TTKIDPVASEADTVTQLQKQIDEEKAKGERENTRRSRIGEALAETAKGEDVTRNTLVEDLAKTDAKRIVQSTLNNEGEFETKITEGEDLEQSKRDARVAEQRKQERRDKPTRLSKADAEIVLEGTEREGQAATKNAASRRKKASERRGRGAPVPEITTPITQNYIPEEINLQGRENEWIPPDVAEEMKKTRPGGAVERRGESWVEGLDAQDLREINERAKAGDPISKSFQDKMGQELRGKLKGRRAGETNAPNEILQKELGTQIRGLELEGKPKAPMAVTTTPGGNMLAEGALPPRAALEAEQAEGARTVRAIPDPERRKVETTLEGSEIEKNTEIGKDGHPKYKDHYTQKGGEIVNMQKPGRTRRPERRKAEGTTPERRTLEERRKFTADLASGNQRTGAAERRSAESKGLTEQRGQDRRGTNRDQPRAQRRSAATETPPRRGVTTYAAVPAEATPATPVAHERGRNFSRVISDLATETSERFKRYRNIVGKVAQTVRGPGIELAGEAAKAQGTQVVGKKGGLARGAGRFGAPVAALATLFGVTEGAKAASETQGSQREKIKAAQETALEVGMDTAVGVTEFSVATWAARRASLAAAGAGTPFLVAAEQVMPIPAMAYTAAKVGETIGKTKHAWDSQVQKEISEKAVMDAKYGTVERATETRRNRNRKISLGETETIMQRWDDEAKAKRDKRIRDAKKVGRRPRGV
ncbi:MAG: hypothetical protein JRC86_08165, partial [Deltaproteobacteria bacterium]|nr:hypothetical protein [Deltaproteobacteria bacterium]